VCSSDLAAAARLHELTYSQFIHGLKKLGVALDRKVLADMAVRDAAGFAELAGKVKGTLAT
jgi:large subunit ribosomal protein L20